MDAKKPSMGRQKIKMAKIQVKNHLQVTFSKRRSGLMKKASELCTLCGVEIAIIVFSPAGKVFPFGHPSVDTIIDRFLTTSTTAGNPPPQNNSSSGALSLVEAHRKASIRELNLRLTQLLSELEVEKKRSEAFEVMRKTNRRHCYYWWETPICELGFHELEQLRDSMEELKKVVVQQASNKLITTHEMTTNCSSSSSSIFTLNINAGAGNLYHQGYESKPNYRDDVIRFGYI